MPRFSQEPQSQTGNGNRTLAGAITPDPLYQRAPIITPLQVLASTRHQEPRDQRSRSPNPPWGHKSLPPNPLRPPLTQQLELGQPAKPWGSQGQAAPARWAIQSQSRQEKTGVAGSQSQRGSKRAKEERDREGGRRGGEKEEQAEP